MTDIERRRRAALMLNKVEFDRLDNGLVGAVGQAFGTSGRIYSQADRERVWDAIEQYRRERGMRSGS